MRLRMRVLMLILAIIVLLVPVSSALAEPPEPYQDKWINFSQQRKSYLPCIGDANGPFFTLYVSGRVRMSVDFEADNGENTANVENITFVAVPLDSGLPTYEGRFVQAGASHDSYVETSPSHSTSNYHWNGMVKGDDGSVLNFTFLMSVNRIDGEKLVDISELSCRFIK